MGIDRQEVGVGDSANYSKLGAKGWGMGAVVVESSTQLATSQRKESWKPIFWTGESGHIHTTQIKVRASSPGIPTRLPRTSSKQNRSRAMPALTTAALPVAP